MSVEATYDVLVLCERVHGPIDVLDIQEIHHLLYLAQVLSVFDGRRFYDWSYSFSVSENGGPWSSDVFEAIEILHRSGAVHRKLTQVTLSEKGVVFLSNVRTLPTLKWRIPYIQGAADASLGRSLPEVLASIEREPILRRALGSHFGSVLDAGNSLEIVYQNAKTLQSLLGDEDQDLWLVANIWLDYWSREQPKRGDLFVRN